MAEQSRVRVDTTYKGVVSQNGIGRGVYCDKCEEEFSQTNEYQCLCKACYMLMEEGTSYFRKYTWKNGPCPCGKWCESVYLVTKYKKMTIQSSMFMCMVKLAAGRQPGVTIEQPTKPVPADSAIRSMHLLSDKQQTKVQNMLNSNMKIDLVECMIAGYIVKNQNAAKNRQLNGAQGERTGMDGVNKKDQDGWFIEHRIILKKRLDSCGFLKNAEVACASGLALMGIARGNWVPKPQEPEQEKTFQKQEDLLSKSIAAKVAKGVRTQEARRETFKEWDLARAKNLDTSCTRLVEQVDELGVCSNTVEAAMRLEVWIRDKPELELVKAKLWGTDAGLLFSEVESGTIKLSDLCESDFGMADDIPMGSEFQDILTELLQVYTDTDLKAEPIVGVKFLLHAAHFTTMREWNKKMHSLNGNTNRSADYWAANVAATVSTVQNNIPILTNNTTYDLKWKHSETTFAVSSVSIAINGFQYMLVATKSAGFIPSLGTTSAYVSAPGVTIFDLKTFSLAGISAGISLAQVDRRSMARDVTLPPGWTLYVCLVAINFIGATAIWITVGLTEGNRDLSNFPFLTSRAADTPTDVGEIAEEGTVYLCRVKLNEKLWHVPIDRLNRDEKGWLEEELGTSKNVSFRTRAGNRVASFQPGEEYYLHIGLVGGMMAGAVPADSPAEGSTIKEAKTEAVRETKPVQIPDCVKPFAEELKRLLVTGETMLSTNGSGLDAAIAVWAASLRTTTSEVQDQPAKNVTQWFESWTGDPTTFIGGAIVQTTVFDLTGPYSHKKPASVANALSVAWDTYRKTGEVATLGQVMRIRTDLLEGSAAIKMLISSAGTYLNKRTGSAASLLLRGLLMAYGMTPLLGCEQLGIDGGSNALDRPIATSQFTSTFYMAPASQYNIPVNARVIDMGTWIAIISNNATPALPPLGYTLADIGARLAVILIPQSIMANPDAAAAWTLMHIEHPYAPVAFNTHFVDLLGFTVAPAAAGRIWGKAAYSRVPYLSSVTTCNILYVMMDVYSPNTMAEMVVGTVGVTAALSPGANGLGGVAIDISPNLIAAQGSIGTFPVGLDIAITTWYQLYGNIEDHNAAWVAASCGGCYIGPYGSSLLTNMNNNFYYQGASAGLSAPPYVGNYAGAVAVTNPTFLALGASCTMPDIYSQYATIGIQDQLNIVRKVGVFDPVSLTYVAMGLVNFKSPMQELPADCFNKALIMRRMGRTITALFDEAAAYLGIDWMGLYNQDRLGVQAATSKRLATETRRVIYDIFKQVLEDCGGATLSYDHYNSPIPPGNSVWLNYANADVISTTRVPRANRPWIQPAMAAKLPKQSYMIDKLPEPADQVRAKVTSGLVTNNSIYEVMEIGVADGDQQRRHQQALATQTLVKANHQPPPLASGFVIAKGQLSQNLRYAVRLTNPSCGVQPLLAMEDFFPTRPSACTLPDQLGPTDVPFMEHLPQVSTVLNYDLQLVWASDSYLFNTYARSRVTQYLQTLLPDTESLSEATVGEFEKPNVLLSRLNQYKPAGTGTPFQH